MGIAKEEPLRRTKTSLRKGRGNSLILVVGHAVDSKSLGYCFINRVAWIKCPGRILKDELNATAIRLECLARIVERFTVNENRSLGGTFQTEEGAGQGCFTAATFANESNNFAVTQLKIDAINSSSLAATSAASEGDDQFMSF
jgi:hypothetical protein